MTRRSIAFFDFDGTITTRDTLIEMVKHHKGSIDLLTGMLKLSPWLIAMKLKLISNQTAKEKLLAHFFKGVGLRDFEKKCETYITHKLPSIIRNGALKEFEKLKNNNTEIVIVSASPELWVNLWCRQNGFHCIATKLQVSEGRITGKISGLNCYGVEKVRRIKEQYNLDDYVEIFCYGDTKGDKPMLALATSSFYKPFRSAEY